MKQFLKRTAFFLGVAAVLAGQLHFALADASHASQKTHDCVVCHSISSADLAGGATGITFHAVEEAFETTSSIFLPVFSFLSASPRAPPAV